MAFEAIQAIVGTAIVDAGFRRDLVESTEDALRTFELTPEESAVISGIQADTFHGFVRKLQDLLERNVASSPIRSK